MAIYSNNRRVRYILVNTMRIALIYAVLHQPAFVSAIDSHLDTPPLTKVDGSGEGLSNWNGCIEDSDCIVLDGSCGGCCEVAAINKKFSANFSDEMEKRCRGHSGPSCDCIPPFDRAICRKSRCELVPNPHYPYGSLEPEQ